MYKNNLKIDVQKEFTNDGSDKLKKSTLFLHRNGGVNWFATDYLMSNYVTNGSKNSTKGMIRYFLEFLEDYDVWKNGNAVGKPVPLGLVSDEHLFDYISYIEDDIGLNRNGIANRVRAALYFLNYIQDNYNLDYKLISTSNMDGTHIDKGLVNAKWLKNTYRNKKYIHHDSIPKTEDYGSRFPITNEAIESLWDDLERLEDSGEVYTYELLSTLITLLENTGVRVSEAAEIGEDTVELLRLQVNALLKNKKIELQDIVNINKLSISTKSLQATEAIYRKSSLSNAGKNIAWIKIKTTKGSNKGNYRIVPISFTAAQNIIKFYDNYIINELDRISNKLMPINRARDNKLFIHPKSHLPMSGQMISKLFYDVFSRKYKSNHRRTPHLFRHRFITKLVIQQLENLTITIGGTQLANLILKRIQGLTGHASITTMLHYVELAEAELYGNDNDLPTFDEEERAVLINELGEDKVSELEEKIALAKVKQSITQNK
ncbi:hypothetical protein AB9R81_18130 [Vibrio cyclitrophicus]|uniref:site-specific integrase n=1 Tax=Vibrio cyclitrophicus TaxID=47951 RepID=UPI000C83BE9F|nr:site-specific integrase [Vibrio cyclitrophicus]PMJ42482.1 hypothetical protein BCU24_08105 [Vibrio cyclitrophicus]